MIYSLIITANESNLRLFDYLVYLFEKLAASKNDIDSLDMEPLMPWSDKLPEYLRLSK